jgi:hypothetical protein
VQLWRRLSVSFISLDRQNLKFNKLPLFYRSRTTTFWLSTHNTSPGLLHEITNSANRNHRFRNLCWNPL